MTEKAIAENVNYFYANWGEKMVMYGSGNIISINHDL